MIYVQTILAIGSIGSLLITFYRWVYYPYTERIEKTKENIYKPLHSIVEKLVYSVQNYNDDICAQTYDFWKREKKNIPQQLYMELENIFEKRYKEYCSWRKEIEYYIKFMIYFYVDRHFKDLKEEYAHLGYGSLQDALHYSLLIPILKGYEINLTWFKEHDPELWKNLERCSQPENIRNLFGWLKQESPFIEKIQKIQLDLIKEAKDLKKELEIKII